MRARRAAAAVTAAGVLFLGVWGITTGVNATTPVTPIWSEPPQPTPTVVPTLAPPPLPAVSDAPAGGFLCKDSTTSYAQQRQGACSHHGGVR